MQDDNYDEEYNYNLDDLDVDDDEYNMGEDFNNALNLGMRGKSEDGEALELSDEEKAMAADMAHSLGWDEDQYKAMHDQGFMQGGMTPEEYSEHLAEKNAPRDENGEVMRDADGKPLKKDADGNAVHADGSAAQNHLTKDAEGNFKDKDGKEYHKDEEGNMVDKDGNQIDKSGFKKEGDQGDKEHEEGGEKKSKYQQMRDNASQALKDSKLGKAYGSAKDSINKKVDGAKDAVKNSAVGKAATKAGDKVGAAADKVGKGIDNAVNKFHDKTLDLTKPVDIKELGRIWKIAYTTPKTRTKCVAINKKIKTAIVTTGVGTFFFVLCPRALGNTVGAMLALIEGPFGGIFWVRERLDFVLKNVPLIQVALKALRAALLSMAKQNPAIAKAVAAQ